MRGPHLRIVSFNDVYSLENLPRLATLLAASAADGAADRTLVVLAGDFLAPSILSSLDRRRGVADCLNALGVTHVPFRNREDDVPLPELRHPVGQLQAP